MRSRAPARGQIGAGARLPSRFVLEQIVVEAFESYWALADAECAGAHFAADAVLINHCPSHLSSLGGEHHGPDAILSARRRLDADFMVCDPCVKEIFVDGLHLSLSYSLRLRHIGTGRSGRISGMSHVFLDGELRIARIENCFDSAAFAEIGDLLEAFAARGEALDCMKRASLAASLPASLGASPDSF